MVFLARLADFIALLGFVAGLLKWRGLDRARRFLVGFCGVSAVCGIGQAILKGTGFTTAWLGNVWDLAVLALLLPSCMMVMRSGLREPFKPIQILAVGTWVWVNIILGGLPQYDDLISMSFYALLALIGTVLFSQFIDDPLELWKKPEFILALVALTAGCVDTLNSLALSHYSVLDHRFLVGLMITRNAVWCGTYALLAYSLLLKGRSRGELRGGVSVYGETRVGRDEELHRRSRRPRGFHHVWDHSADAK